MTIGQINKIIRLLDATKDNLMAVNAEMTEQAPKPKKPARRAKKSQHSGFPNFYRDYERTHR